MGGLLKWEVWEFNVNVGRTLNGGGSPSTFCEPAVFEIAVDRQTRTLDQSFEGSRTRTAHRWPRCSHAHIWPIFGPIMPNHPQRAHFV